MKSAASERAASGSLERLLEASPQIAARERERARAFLLEGCGPLVLFGAGGLGRRTLQGLRSEGLEPVAFSDNAESLWGSMVDGLPVLAPRDAAARFARTGRVVVTVWRAEGGHTFAGAQVRLRRLGWRNVEPFLTVYRALPERFLPYFACGLPSEVSVAADDVSRACSLFADEPSRHEFFAQVRWRLAGEFSTVSEPSHGCSAANEYWPAGVFTPSSGEAVVDCGAFTGDTLVRFAERFGDFRSWTAYEPDPENAARLERRVRGLPHHLVARAAIRRFATGERRGHAGFVAAGTASSSMADRDAATTAVPVVALDEESFEHTPTFIKLDVEGHEAQTILGAQRLLAASAPALAVCCYHRPRDLWEIPLLLHRVCPEARMSLRAHAAEGFDLVLYVVPEGRTPGSRRR